MRSRILILLLLTLSGGLNSAVAMESLMAKVAKSLEILRIMPSGEDVAAERQVVFTFNQPVVPVGKMEREAAEIPITIKPALKCQWRWLDTSNLACQLGDETALQSATRYDIEIMPGITTTTGQTLSKTINHTFITQRPQVDYVSFKTWQNPGMPILRVTFNQPVTRESVEQHLYIVDSLQQKRIPLAVERPKPEEEVENKDLPENVSYLWIVSPQTILPTNSKVELKVEPGIQSHLGSELGVETRVATQFQTFPKLTFLGLQCTNLKGNEVTIPIGQSAKFNNQRCDPLQSVSLRFSSPVLQEMAKTSLLITPDLAGGRQDYDPWEGIPNYSQLDETYEQDKVYRVWLPIPLKAYQTYQVKSDLATFKDEFGRPLPDAINFKFLTDHRAPLHVFEHDLSILEQGVDSEVPIYVTNLDKLTFSYNLFDATKGWLATKRKTIPISKVKDVAFKIPLGIRQMLPDATGIVQGYFTSQPDVNNENAANDNWFFSQITPFYVQAKVGHHNTLVWVMDFATGQPVKDVKVSVYLDTYAPDNSTTMDITQENSEADDSEETTTETLELEKALATTVTDAQGMAWLPGTTILDPQMKHAYVYGEYKTAPRLFIQCQQGNSTTLLPLDSAFKVEISELSTENTIYSSNQPKYGHIHTWGTTAQGIYKVGDTIQYKLFVRDQSNETMIAAPKEGYNLQVIDPMGKVVHEVKSLTLSEFGATHGEFEIPKTAAVGWYDFKLTADFQKDIPWYPMRVLVSDFTPSPFRVQTTLNGELFHIGEPVTVDTAATLHAGGPYVNAPAKVTAILSQQDFTPSQAKGFIFDVYQDNVTDETIHSTEGQLNDKGQLQTTFTLSAESKVLYGKLMIESAVRDDRGKDVATNASAKYVGRDRFVGLKETSWLLTAGKPGTVKLLVVDELGNPISGADIAVQIEHLETTAAQAKSAGNAYIGKYEHEWVKEGVCAEGATVKSNLKAVNCTFTPTKSGSYQIVANIKDTQQREHHSALQQWATGKDYVLWETTPGHGLEIVPERESYQVGETARYLVKNPYPGAQALVTVERFGIIKTWLTTLKTSMEIIEVPIVENYLPRFFVSVTVMSPRVDKPVDTNQVDLGKPAFRMGYAETLVEDPYKEIVVDIQTDKPVYRPKETVTINFQAKPRHAAQTAQPVELAITVLDESVFDLLVDGRSYFDPYQGFYTEDSLDMANYSLIMRLVGRQKFEKKGATAGGDGGAAGLSMRSLFKFVSYWNPAVPTDAEGKAQIKFNVPDNLTGWRVLAMAVTPTDRMGLSDTSFKVNQPIEIRPVLPNQVLQGDSFQAGFNVMNRTDKVRTLAMTLDAKGPIVMPANPQNTFTITAQPYKRYTQWLPLVTNGAGTIEFTATAKDAEEQDGLRQTLTVHPRRANTTAATYGTSVESQVTEAIDIPKDIYTDTGGLTVIASPTVIGGIEGAFEYMRDYPYACWEQKLSKATMASHYQQLHNYLTQLAWENSKALPEHTLNLATEYQAPNGGMAYFEATDDRVSPYLSAFTAMAFNWLREAGYTVPTTVEEKLHEYLLTLLRKDVMPDFYSKGMSASVRAVALAALAKHGKITRQDIQRYESHVNYMDLFGKSQFLMAATQVPGTGRINQQVVDKILSYLDQTAGRIAFKESTSDDYGYLLSSSLRTQCAILSSLVRYHETQSDDSQISDIPFKLVRNITYQRKTNGHWENTQENLFCMNALIDYSRSYEKDQPMMTVKSWLDAEKMGETQFDKVTNPPVTFTHPMQPADPGRKATVRLEREGQGRMYYTVRLTYAEKNETAKAVNAGIEVQREYHVERNGKWILLTNPMEIKTGELVKVDLYISIPASRYFVVVNDPIPGGLEPVNRDLATTSQLDADKADQQYATGSFWFRHQRWSEYADAFWSFYHKELRHHAAIFYSEYLSQGNYHLSYVAQAIASGEFTAMPTVAEEMYEPEVFGKSVPAILKVSRDADEK